MRTTFRTLLVILACLVGLAGVSASAADSTDGSHDFDFHTGKWKTHVRRLVHLVINDITPTSIGFEQAFSADEGKTWEVNWIATDTRIPESGV